MGSMSIWHWMLFGAVALLLFGGKGKISDIMGDVAKGIKSFKKGMTEDDETPPAGRRAARARNPRPGDRGRREAEGRLIAAALPFSGRAAKRRRLSVFPCSILTPANSSSSASSRLR